jgi:SAM-dependent methyltransferase
MTATVAATIMVTAAPRPTPDQITYADCVAVVKRFLTRLRVRRRPGRADDGYNADYFGEGRNPLDRMGLSGYERYERDTSNANIAAYVLWRFFDARTALDVGCATGFVVEALREVDIEAQGCDVSRWAVANASSGAIGHLHVGDLTDRLPFAHGRFQLVAALETLEHLAPIDVPGALSELRRVTSRWVVATIPSIGHNDYGPHGFPNSKVPDHRLEHYLALGPGFDGPIPGEDLARDANGRPIEGHLTIASFRWWTERFAEAGMNRRGDIEQRIHPVLARFGLTEFWNLYVFDVGDTVAQPTTRQADDIAAVEHRWGLSDARPTDRALQFLQLGLGDEAVRAARAEPPY